MAAGKLRPQKRCPLFLHKGMQISPNAEWTLRTDPHGAHTHFILKHALGVPLWCKFLKEKQAQLTRPTRTALMCASIDAFSLRKFDHSSVAQPVRLKNSTIKRCDLNLRGFFYLKDLSQSFTAGVPKRRFTHFVNWGKKVSDLPSFQLLVSPVDNPNFPKQYSSVKCHRDGCIPL